MQRLEKPLRLRGIRAVAQSGFDCVIESAALGSDEGSAPSGPKHRRQNQTENGLEDRIDLKNVP